MKALLLMLHSHSIKQSLLLASTNGRSSPSSSRMLLLNHRIHTRLLTSSSSSISFQQIHKLEVYSVKVLVV